MRMPPFSWIIATKERATVRRKRIQRIMSEGRAPNLKTGKIISANTRDKIFGVHITGIWLNLPFLCIQNKS
jgi:hypothetical protein